MQSHSEYYRLPGTELHSGVDAIEEAIFLNDDLKARVEALTSIAEILGITDFKHSTYASAIAAKSEEELSLQRTLLHLKRAEASLEEHLHEVTLEEKLIQKWIQAISNSEPPPQENVATLERRTDALVAKAREYQKELEAVMVQIPGAPSPTISELSRDRERLRLKEQELKMKRAKIQAYQGLPPNIELAHMELRRAEEEQMQLIRLRERLLNNMAANVS